MRGRLPLAGALTGTGAEIDVNLGFRPRYVKVVDITQLATAEAIDGMPDGKGLLEVTAGTKSQMSSGGLTITPNGFTIGTNANLNTASDVIYYAAF